MANNQAGAGHAQAVKWRFRLRIQPVGGLPVKTAN
jgi:hypothetical protein